MTRKTKIPPGIPERIEVTNILDLHGFFPEQVEEIVTAFIENAKKLRIHSLKIVHGKGKSRLKFEVYQVLEKNCFVKSFKDAPPDMGGWGVTVVELK